MMFYSPIVVSDVLLGRCCLEISPLSINMMGNNNNLNSGYRGWTMINPSVAYAYE